MRALKVLIVILVMLGVCAPSFGYVLVYNVVSRVRAVDNDAGKLVGTAVKGYLVMDFNDANNDFNEAAWITYGKDSESVLVYTGPDDPGANVTLSGNYQSVSMFTGDGWTIMVAGKIVNKAIGLSNRAPIAYTMSGNFIVDSGSVYDGDMFDGDILTGSGAITITLNTVKTKAANQASESIDDVSGDLTDALDAADYTGV